VTLEDYVVHHLPGRVRLRLPSLRGEAETLGQVQGWIRQLPGVRRVQANPVTGSVLVHYDVEAEGALFTAAREALALLGGDEAPPANALQGLSLAAQVQRVRAAVGDLAPFLSLGLVGLGALQAVRGNTLAPAVSMLWYALDLLRSSDHRSGSGAGPS
jgi:hypothetical protein